MDEIRQQALEESKNQVNWKQVEEDAIADLLRMHKLRIHEIPPDGHCLYNAVAHQWNLNEDLKKSDYKKMRETAASFMLEHVDDFLPFAAADDDSVMTEDGFRAYCVKIKESAEWGGQLELRALSAALQRPIHVIQMGMPTLKIGEEFSGIPIVLS